MDETKTTEVLVGTQDGLHRLGGAGAVPDVKLSGHEVNALAGEGEAWWAIADGETVWRSDLPGWREVGRAREVRANCLCLSSLGMFVGTSEGHLLRLNGNNLEPVESFDRADGRDEWYTPWGGPPDVRSISRSDDGTVYANIHVGGVVRSTDQAVSWEPTLDIHSDVHQVLAPSGHPGVVLAACARGLARSGDGGDTWSFETEGLHAAYCRAVAVGDGTIYLSASLSHRGNRACLYRRPLDGGAFEKCEQGLPEWFSDNIDTFCVVATGSQVAFGTNDGWVFASGDSGSTWEAWAEGLPPVRCVAFA